MKTFRQFIREMPSMTDLDKDHIHPNEQKPVVRDGQHVNGQYHHALASSDTHNFYTTKYGKTNSHQFEGIVATNKKGHTEYNVEGYGDHKKKRFTVSSATSATKRTMPYHKLISHLLVNKHLDSWVSDHSHTKGSRQTYQELCNHPDLDVHHVPDHGVYAKPEDADKKTKVTPENFDDTYNHEGHFEVTRKNRN